VKRKRCRSTPLIATAIGCRDVLLAFQTHRDTPDAIASQWDDVGSASAFLISNRVCCVEHDVAWDMPLFHRVGAEERLCGIDVFYEFRWLDVFRDERTQFKNGKSLAKFVEDKCAPGKTPALLLTLRADVHQGLLQTERFSVFVVNIEEYRATEGDAAMSYLANHLGVDITDIEQLRAVADSADPHLLRTFIESSLDIGHIAEWAFDNEARLAQLQELAGAAPDRAPATLGETLRTIDALGDLSAEDLRALAEFLTTPAEPEQRLELARAATANSAGRRVVGEALAERTSERVADAREAVLAYNELLADSSTTETVMQRFIEQHLWLLGLDYAAIRPRASGPSGAMDFMLKRFDGFHDLLELKSPQDPIVRSPAIEEGAASPPPHEYALSTTLGQALAQALVYRDRLTRHAEAATELFGLEHSRDPRLILVLGRVDDLPPDRRRVLTELNKSLHRVEIVPYDVLSSRATAVLDNIELHFSAAAADSHPSAGAS
jgi:hypothetical protein